MIDALIARIEKRAGHMSGLYSAGYDGGAKEQEQAIWDWNEMQRLARLGAAVEAEYKNFSWNSDDGLLFASKIARIICKADINKIEGTKHVI